MASSVTTVEVRGGRENCPNGPVPWDRQTRQVSRLLPARLGFRCPNMRHRELATGLSRSKPIDGCPVARMDHVPHDTQATANERSASRAKRVNATKVIVAPTIGDRSRCHMRENLRDDASRFVEYVFKAKRGYFIEYVFNRTHRPGAGHRGDARHRTGAAAGATQPASLHEPVSRGAAMHHRVEVELGQRTFAASCQRTTRGLRHAHRFRRSRGRRAARRQNASRRQHRCHSFKSADTAEQVTGGCHLAITGTNDAVR